MQIPPGTRKHKYALCTQEFNVTSLSNRHSFKKKHRESPFHFSFQPLLCQNEDQNRHPPNATNPPSEYFPQTPPQKSAQILVATGPLLSTIGLGMTSGFSAVLLPQLHNTTLVASPNDASWIASMAALPMAFGCVFGGFLMENFGRKTTQILTTIPSLIGWLLIGFSSDIWMILTGRFLTGLCGGLLGPSTGVYISETSEPRFRGFLLASISLAMALGLFFVHFLGTFLTWRTTSGLSLILPVLSLVVLNLVPESPSWLAKKGRNDEAQKSFFWCRGESDQARKELTEMLQRYKNQTLETEKIKLISGEFLKPLAIIVVFIVTNQWAGVNALTFYTVTIMGKTLGPGLDEYLAMLVVDLIRVAMSIATCFIMKRIGRRPLALISGFGTFTSLFLLSAYSFTTRFVRLDFPLVPMGALVAYITFITIGFVPLPWAMMGEVFPQTHRNVGSSVSSFMAFVAFFSVVKTSPAMFDCLGTDGTFMVYGAVAFFGTIFNWFFLPETKDKTLGEIEDEFK
nr:PREDICTED: facilitated trehalose transporter Tret1-2 homolog isoform X1 [Tribolium castaneum]|eukprot:XP_008194649.1 PREDICTED: facilitated trehalose transporter Tret1-2 homolog isoform X1 [Tribolium castaneum]